MRRLQPLRQRLPGRGLHHHGALAPGTVDARTGQVVRADYANWTTHPNNPMAKGGGIVRTDVAAGTSKPPIDAENISLSEGHRILK